MNYTAEWMAAVDRYETLSEALADYYDCYGAFGPSEPLTASLTDLSRRSGITTTQALEEMFQRYKNRKDNRL